MCLFSFSQVVLCICWALQAERLFHDAVGCVRVWSFIKFSGSVILTTGLSKCVKPYTHPNLIYDTGDTHHPIRIRITCLASADSRVRGAKRTEIGSNHFPILSNYICSVNIETRSISQSHTYFSSFNENSSTKLLWPFLQRNITTFFSIQKQEFYFTMKVNSGSTEL